MTKKRIDWKCQPIWVLSILSLSVLKWFAMSISTKIIIYQGFLNYALGSPTFFNGDPGATVWRESEEVRTLDTTLRRDFSPCYSFKQTGTTLSDLHIRVPCKSLWTGSHGWIFLKISDSIII